VLYPYPLTQSCYAYLKPFSTSNPRTARRHIEIHQPSPIKHHTTEPTVQYNPQKKNIPIAYIPLFSANPNRHGPHLLHDLQAKPPPRLLQKLHGQPPSAKRKVRRREVELPHRSRNTRGEGEGEEEEGEGEEGEGREGGGGGGQERMRGVEEWVMGIGEGEE
jgi:hypothetical protein